MASSKNPIREIDVPQDILDLAKKNPGIVCNPRIDKQLDLKIDLKNKNKDEIRRILSIMFDTFNFCEEMETFLKAIQPGTRMILVCQSFGEDIFTLVTDVTRIYWADRCYPRIDFEKRPRVVRKVFGESNLWGGFILAAAKVGRVKRQGCLGYGLLFDLAKRRGGIISP